MHEQRAHKNWHDERQVENMDPKKAPWSAEEQALLARQEAKLILKKTKFMNQALLPLFPNRSLEAIKGQRKYQKHKDKVLQILGELEEQKEAFDRPVPQVGVPIHSQCCLVESINELFAKLEPINGINFRAEHLNHICDNISRWPISTIAAELEVYLLEVFPPAPGGRKLGNGKPKQNMTRRQIRRADYARTQRAWKKNPCNCLRDILKNKTSNNPPEKEAMTLFWQTVMTQGTCTSPENDLQRPVKEDLWKPITAEEIKGSFPKLTTCPGPDGISSRQLRAVPPNVLIRIFNLFLLCGRLPEHLLKAKTTLIPKKDGAERPEDYRPITVQSVITRAFHKILATRLTNTIALDPRQKAFLPTDGCAENIFCLDMILKYHRQNFKPLYMASIDIAKAFDSVSHKSIRDTLTVMGLPSLMTEYIMDTYNRCTTILTCHNWESDDIRPACGVKQGDPLSPIIFNMVIDRLLQRIPPEIGVTIGNSHFDVMAFADDLIFVATTPEGLQIMLDTAGAYLTQCGLKINATKSFSVAVKNVPHLKKSVIDGKTKFTCLDRPLPSLKREDEWKYLGVPFTPEGRTKIQPEVQLKEALEKLSKAPLKPQQRLFALRVMVLPGLYHLLTLGNTTLSRLKKIDAVTRAAVRKWVCLPHDTVNAYFHANVRDGGLSIPSMRWLMPLHRKLRLEQYSKGDDPPNPYLSQEIQKATRRLTVNRQELDSTQSIKEWWAMNLHSSIDGKGLRESYKIPQQHRWVIDGSHFLSGRDFISGIKLRINAMPTRSRVSRGRRSDRHCRAGCNATETLNHVLQQCHRTHKARIERHDAITAYIKRALYKKCEKVEEEPRFNTTDGIRKPDLVAKRGTTALVIDAQVVSEHMDLSTAHAEKARKYQPLEHDIKQRYAVHRVLFTSATLSYRGVWSEKSANDLTSHGILQKSELKVISTRVLVGGLNSFWRFNKATSTLRRNIRPRAGIG